MTKTNQLVLTIILSVLVVGFFGYKLYIGQVDNVIKNITTTELASKMKTDIDPNKFIYVDVREDYEYQAGHIKGMTNVPLSTLKENYTKIPKDKEVVLICHSGNRSMQAANLLKELGYQHITNVQGGISSWGGPVITE